MTTLPLKSSRGGLVTVGISEMAISQKKDEVLATYSLGSCIGLSLHDARIGAAGLIHCMLPQGSLDPEKARQRPAMFVDMGVTALVEGMLALGASRRRLVAKVAGAANVFDDRGMFRIGERNYATLRRILWKNDILIAGEDVGGSAARTMYVSVVTGRVVLKTGSELVDL